MNCSDSSAVDNTHEDHDAAPTVKPRGASRAAKVCITRCRAPPTAIQAASQPVVLASKCKPAKCQRSDVEFVIQS